MIFAGVFGGYGNLVIIKSGNTDYYFAHLARIMVQKGRAYNGEVIGEIGNTGVSSGIHLHYEVRPNGRPINPKPYLNLLDIGRKTGAAAAVQRGTQISAASGSRTYCRAKATARTATGTRKKRTDYLYSLTFTTTSTANINGWW